MTRKVEAQVRLVWLDLLKGPWNPDGREFVEARRKKLGWSQEEFARKLWAAGWEGSGSTLGRMLRGGYWDGEDWRESLPNSDELQLFAAVLAGYSANWPKASNLSSPQSSYSFWVAPDPELVPAA